MKSSRVFIKANYIKKAKGDWVYCDAHILTHDKFSILKLTSINADNKVSEVETIKRLNLTAGGLKVLLNLSEFKSSEIKPVNFRNTEKFAIKLIPSGILHTKKLFIVPENDEDLTKWCGLLTEQVHRSKELENKSKVIGDVITNGTIKIRGKSEALETNNNVNQEEVKETKPEKIIEKKDDKEEIFFAMDDNDVYDGNSLEHSYAVCIEESADSKNLNLKGSYILRLKEEGLELADIKMGEIIHKFPYIFIRRFGAKEDILRLEAGRKCTTGEGYLMFRFKDAQTAVDTIRELVRELKKSVSTSQIDCSTISNRNSIIMSPVNNDVESDKSVTRNTWINNSYTPSIISSNNNINVKSRFFSQESSPVIKSPPPVISPKPQISPLAIKSQTNHPLYSSINSGRHTAINRPPIVNNNFNRGNHAVASFSYSQPRQVKIPVTKISQDDSYCQKVNGATDLYDNLPIYDIQNNGGGRYVAHSANSSVKYSSSYSMQGPLTNRVEGNYDNVPNNQRCIQELETMLNDLGIPSH